MTPESFERRILELGLICERIPLQTKPKAIHWHIRKAGEKGTVEATFEDGSVAITIRKNRQGTWTEDALAELGQSD